MLIRERFKYLEEAGSEGSDVGEGSATTDQDTNTDVVESGTGDSTPGSTESTTTAEGTGDSTPGSTEASQAADEVYTPFEMPEGMEVDQSLVDIFAPMMKDAALTQEQAQSFASEMAKMAGIKQQEQIDAFSKQNEDWINEAKADKEYGGDHYNESVGHALRAVESFGTPELKGMLNHYGIGNHPEMVRFMVKVGKATAEDNPGGNAGQSTAVVKDRASILYPEK